MAIVAKQKIDGQDVVKEVAELQRYAESGVTIGLAAGASNVCTITVQAVDGLGAALAGIQQFRLYMSSSAVGATVSAVAYSGSVVATTGAILATVTAKWVFDIITDSTGKWVGSLTDTAKTQNEKAVIVRSRGDIVLSLPTTTALFG